MIPPHAEEAVSFLIFCFVLACALCIGGGFLLAMSGMHPHPWRPLRVLLGVILITYGAASLMGPNP